MSSTDNNKSVSKGKLYKGVEFNSFYGNKAKKEPDIIVNADFVEKLLDEAKKELPEIIPTTSMIRNEAGQPMAQEPDSPYIDGYYVDVFKLKKWKDKWFGEADE